jgi:hypothetical protein
MADAPMLPVAPAFTPPRRLFPWVVAVLLALYLALALANIYRLPPINGPDEGDHLIYVQILREQRAMPILPRFVRPGQETLTGEQAQHPPLYYAVLAVAATVLPDYHTAAGQRALKLVSVLMGLAGLLAFAVCAREMWPEDDTTALAAVGCVALMPMYAVMTSLINNSAGSLCASGFALMLLRRALAEPSARRWLLVGLAVGLGMVAKITALWLVPVVVVAWWLGRKAARGAGVPPATRTAEDSGRDARTTRYILAALGPIVLLAGSWLAYNLVRFGEIMPERVLDRRYLPLGLATILFLPMARDLLILVTLVTIPLSTFAPYWLLRTGMEHETGVVILILYLGPPLLALALIGWRRRRELWASPTPRQALLVAGVVGILAAWSIAVQAVLHDWNTGLYAGRYAVDSVPALALLFAAGMRALLPWPKARAAAVVAWLAALLVIAVLVHVMVVAFFQYGKASLGGLGGL